MAIREKLNDIGVWVGADGTSYMKVRLLLESIERLDHEGDELAEEWVKAFNLVYNTMKRAVDE